MNITWLPEAEVELNLAADWYEDRLPLLGSRFVNDVIGLLNHLVFAPRAHPRLPGLAGKRGAPRALLEHFPYALIYTADEDELVLIALIHTSRRRSSWRKRLT